MKIKIDKTGLFLDSMIAIAIFANLFCVSQKSTEIYLKTNNVTRAITLDLSATYFTLITRISDSHKFNELLMNKENKIINDYANEFADLIFRNGINLPVEKRLLNMTFSYREEIGAPETMGVCYRDLNKISFRSDVIERSFRFKAIVFHELSHCMLDLEHVEGINHLLSDSFQKNHWDDLAKTSMMEWNLSVADLFYAYEQKNEQGLKL